LHFKQRNIVFQLQLALFQAPQLKFIVVAIDDQQRDHGIEVAMFYIKFYQAQLDLLCIAHGDHPTGVSKRLVARDAAGIKVQAQGTDTRY
jgi:hypothetical protein